MKQENELPVFHPLAVRCFESVFIPLRKFLIRDLRFLNMPEAVPSDWPVLLVGNHISNWDGFLFREIQKALKPDWPIYSVMLGKELRQRPLFRLLGGLGMEPASAASVARALRSVKGLVKKNPEFFLSYFPQGNIYPSFKRPLGFKAGVDLFARALAPLTVIPVGLHMEPMKGLTPTFFISLGRPMKLDRPSVVHRILEDLVQAEVDRIHALLSRHGGDLPETQSGGALTAKSEGTRAGTNAGSRT
jgi:1-acyl-sn-glycerol-3-phosphate acyltransferase